MPQALVYTYDKFTFEVPTDRCYTADGLWAKKDGDRVTLGVSDFFQQHNGDVAFAEMAEAGTTVSAGEPLADIETIKLDIELASPVSGVVTAVNEALELEAELINRDPYGAGWLAVLEMSPHLHGTWPECTGALMSPEQYLAHMKTQVEAEGS